MTELITNRFFTIHVYSRQNYPQIFSFIICEFQCILGKGLGGFSRGLHDLELKAFFVLDWLPAKLKHPILPYYLTGSDGEKK